MARLLWRRTLLLALLFGIAAISNATTNYTISLANPGRNLVEVQILLPAGAAQRELQLPVWNALYQIRDFAKYANWLRATEPATRSRSANSTQAAGKSPALRTGPSSSIRCS
jgi:hypothetical protein